MTKQPSTRLVNYLTSVSVGLNSFTRLVWNDIATNCLPRKLSPRILNTSASSKMRSRAHRSASSSLKISRHRAGFLLLVKTVIKTALFIVSAVNQIKEQTSIFSIKFAVANLINNQTGGANQGIQARSSFSCLARIRQFVTKLRSFNEIGFKSLLTAFICPLSSVPWLWVIFGICSFSRGAALFSICWTRWVTPNGYVIWISNWSVWNSENHLEVRLPYVSIVPQS